MVLVLALSLLIGIALGLLGGGGSILTVPMLVYAVGMEPKEAIATSLLVVGVTSAAAMVQYARSGHVRWRTGLFFGASGMVGAYLGGRVAAFIPATVLLLLFAVMMLATAWAMLRGRKDPTSEGHGAPDKRHALLHTMLHGLIVGGVTGLVGAGGGFLVVPALALLGGMAMHYAIGTSLLVIAMKSSAGLMGYLGHVQIDWDLALWVSGLAVAGSVLGIFAARKTSPAMLRRVFGWFVVAMAIFIMARELPAAVTAQASLALGS